MRVAGVAADAKSRGGHDDAVGPHAADRLLQVTARALPRLRDQSGPGRDFRVLVGSGPELAGTESSCSPLTEMPSAIPAGTQPVMISLAKSGPDRSAANGRRSGGQPPARTAVPITVNSMAPAVSGSGGISLIRRAAPTIPWPPSSAHWPVIRSIAVRRPR